MKPYLDGIAKGYGKTLADVDWNTPDAKTLQKLTENVFQFSASKDFHILSDMTAALKGSDGKMRSFDEFQAEVDKMNVKYNQNWLRTEYNQAVASSQCAARWTDFEKHSKSMPFLQYQAVMDGNTRAEHAALNGVIKRVDSDFWDKYYPPNGWGCRCEVIQLPGKNHKETPAKDMKFCKVDDMWKVNVGKKGVVFPKGHPYFMGQCSTNSCPLKSRKLADGTLKTQCQGCLQGMGECQMYVEDCKDKTALIAERRQEYEQNKNDPDYLNVEFNEETGGLKATHKEHNFDKKGGKYEDQAQNVGFKYGHSVVFGQERNAPAGKKTEGKWDGLLFEVAGRETATENNVLKGLKHCASKLKTEIAVLVFPNGGFDKNILSNAIIRYRGLEKVKDYHFVRFKKIICIQGEDIVSEIDF